MTRSGGGVLLLLCVACGALAAAPWSKTIEWTRGPDVPQPRGGYFAAWHAGGLVMAGGTYWEDKRKLWSDRVSFYDPAARKWHEWQPLPKPLAYGVMARAGETLYLIGGIGEREISRDIYTLDGRRWRRAGTAPAPFIYAAAVSVGQKIYIFGGGTSNDDLTTANTQAWSYDVADRRWTALAAVPGPPRLVHAVAAIGSQIYLFGGLTHPKSEPYRNLADAYRYDTTRGTWSRIESLPAPTRALWATSVGGDVYLFGGRSLNILRTVDRYDPARDEYVPAGQLPVGLMDTKFFHDRGLFFGAGGEDKPGSRFSGLLIGRLMDKPAGR